MVRQLVPSLHALKLTHFPLPHLTTNAPREQSAADAPVLSFVRAASTVGLGLTSGLMLSIPAWSFPVTYSVPTLSPRDRLHLWSGSYDIGKTTMLTSIPTITALLGAASFFGKTPPLYLPANFIARHRRAVLAWTAVLTFVNLPFTFFFIIPKVNTLKRIESDIVKDSATAGKIDTDSLVKEWTYLHGFRVLFGVAAFALSVAELVSA